MSDAASLATTHHGPANLAIGSEAQGSMSGSPLAAFLADLDAAKTAAGMAETSFRAEAAAREKELATERAYAYRRADLMAGLARSVADAETAEMAEAAGRALLAARLGWAEASPARDEVMLRFAALARALHKACAADARDAEGGTATEECPADDPPAALAAFEDWYLATRRTAFWHLFDHYLPETPVVDF